MKKSEKLILYDAMHVMSYAPMLCFLIRRHVKRIDVLSARYQLATNYSVIFVAGTAHNVFSSLHIL